MDIFLGLIAVADVVAMCGAGLGGDGDGAVPCAQDARIAENLTTYTEKASAYTAWMDSESSYREAEVRMSSYHITRLFEWRCGLGLRQRHCVSPLCLILFCCGLAGI